MGSEVEQLKKAEILEALRLAGDLHRKTKTPAWMAAFEYYWATTGDKNLKPGCGACYEHLQAWLRR